MQNTAWHLASSPPNKDRGNVLVCDHAGRVSIAHARTVTTLFHEWWTEIPPRPEMPPFVNPAAKAKGDE